jgi:hypothetical protein
MVLDAGSLCNWMGSDKQHDSHQMERIGKGVIPLDTGSVCAIEGSCACGGPAGWSEWVPSISMLVAISVSETGMYRQGVKVGEAETKREQLQHVNRHVPFSQLRDGEDDRRFSCFTRFISKMPKIGVVG